MSTKSENLVKIGAIDSEIFGGLDICRFFPNFFSHAQVTGTQMSIYTYM